jgi:hypothetical protein
MSTWKDLVIGSIKLADEVKRLTHELDGLENDVRDIDKRVVRLETMVEISQNQPKQLK